MTISTEDAILKKDLLEALGNIEDPGQKVVLMLLIRSMDSINTKLDMVLSDEEKLKHIVLNGHTAKHEEHHNWIELQTMRTEDIGKTVDFVKNRSANSGYCDYAARMLAEEKNTNASKRKIVEGVLEKVILGLLMLIAGAVGSKYLGI